MLPLSEGVRIGQSAYTPLPPEIGFAGQRGVNVSIGSAPGLGALARVREGLLMGCYMYAPAQETSSCGV